MSKGSNRRPTDEQAYAISYDRIFGKPKTFVYDASISLDDLKKPMNSPQQEIIAKMTAQLNRKINGN